MNNLLISGGWFIWPLLVCSILLISIVLERLWFLQRRLVAPKGLLRQIQNLIKKDSFHSQNQQDISITSHLGDLLQHCYQYKSYPREFVEVKAEEKASKRAAKKIGLGIYDYEGTAEGYYSDIEKFLETLSDPEVSKDTGFIDHRRSVMWLYNIYE